MASQLGTEPNERSLLIMRSTSLGSSKISHEGKILRVADRILSGAEGQKWEESEAYLAVGVTVSIAGVAQHSFRQAVLVAYGVDNAA